MEDRVRRSKHNPRASMEPQVVLTEQDARRAYEYRVIHVVDALVSLQRDGMRFPSDNLYWDVATRLRLTAKLSKKTGMPETISLDGERHMRVHSAVATERWFDPGRAIRGGQSCPLTAVEPTTLTTPIADED